jgi:hypothetical protein
MFMPKRSSNTVRKIGLNRENFMLGCGLTAATVMLGMAALAQTQQPQGYVTVLSGVFATGYGETFDNAKLKILPAGSFYTEPANVPHFIEIGESTNTAGERHRSQWAQVRQSARESEIDRRHGPCHARGIGDPPDPPLKERVLNRKPSATVDQGAGRSPLPCAIHS